MSTTPPSKKTPRSMWHALMGHPAWGWFQKILALIIFSVVANHLANPDSFPGGGSYRFPVEGFVFSMVFCVLVGIIAYLNFTYYRKKHFSKKVETSTIARFMGSTMGYITIIYVPMNIVFNMALGAETEFYFVLIGLLISLLLSFTLIGLWYAQDIYKLYTYSLKDAEITIESGAKMTKLTYENIQCFYIENKIVYTVQNDGTIIHTDFTLNELEEKINDQLFFRANRKIIIHKEAIQQIEKIENGKLRIRLKAPIDYDALSEINISRYKRKAFMDWFQ